MDIWQWYNQYERDLHAAGQPYITDHLNKLINAICDVKPDVSEALLPEARSFKKTAGNPWLEVFIGHWEMRHRLGMGEGETALGDAVTFFERPINRMLLRAPNLFVLLRISAIATAISTVRAGQMNVLPCVRKQWSVLRRYGAASSVYRTSNSAPWSIKAKRSRRWITFGGR
jgi:hypothetical protein